MLRQSAPPRRSLPDPTYGKVAASAVQYLSHRSCDTAACTGPNGYIFYVFPIFCSTSSATSTNIRKKRPGTPKSEPGGGPGPPKLSQNDPKIVEDQRKQTNTTTKCCQSTRNIFWRQRRSLILYNMYLPRSSPGIPYQMLGSAYVFPVYSWV